MKEICNGELKDFTIDAVETSTKLGSEIGKLKIKLKQLEDIRKLVVDPVNKSKNKVQSFFNGIKDDPEILIKQLNEKLSEFELEMERQREKERREKELELEKQKNKIKEDLLSQAGDFKEVGDHQTAAEIEAEAENLTPPVPIDAAEPKAKKTATGKMTKIKKFKVVSVDKPAIMKAYINGDLPSFFINFISIDFTKVENYLNKGGEIDLPGFKISHYFQMSHLVNERYKK